MKHRPRLTRILLGSVMLLCSNLPALSGVHPWRLTELFSNADGTIQFIEMTTFFDSVGDEILLSGQSLSSDTHRFTFPGDLDVSTRNKHLLLATSGFATLPGAPAPDYIIPDNFFSTGGDTLTFAAYDTVILPAGSLPTDGMASLNRDEDDATDTTFVATNSPTNLDDQTGSVTAGSGPPGVPDGTGGTTPVTVAPLTSDGSSLQVSYDVTSCANATDHHILFGQRSGLPSAFGGTFRLLGSVCNIGNATPYDWIGVPEPADGSKLIWFLMVATDDNGVEGSWGVDSAEGERLGPGNNGASDICSVVKDATNTCGHTATPINMPTVTVGKDLEVGVNASLGAPAPSYPWQVTIASGDPSKLILSTSATSAGASSIDLTVNSGTVLPTFYAQALEGDGSVVQMAASASGYAPSSGNATLRPSGFVITSPSGDPHSTTTLSANTVLVVACGPLAQTTLAWAGLGAQAVRGGLSGVQVPILSSIPSVGDIIGSPLVFNGGVSSVSSAQFDPLALGSTLVSVEAPVGFSTPSTLRTRTFNVTSPVINMSTVTVGKDLEVNVGAALGAPAPSYPLQVTIASSDPSKLILSTSATAAGASSIDLTVNSGTVLPTFYAQALAGDGSVVQMMASAPGYATSSANVTLRPSGFIIQFPSGDPVSTTTLSANTGLTVICGPLAQTTLAWAGLGPQAVRGGLSGVQVPILSSIPSVGDIIGSPLVFNGGVSSVSSAQFDPVALGSTLVSVEAPVGFSTPSNLRTRTFNVTAPVISFVPRGLPREAGRMSVRDAG